MKWGITMETEPAPWNKLALKQLDILIQNVILFTNVVHTKCNILCETVWIQLIFIQHLGNEYCWLGADTQRHG